MQNYQNTKITSDRLDSGDELDICIIDNEVVWKKKHLINTSYSESQIFIETKYLLNALLENRSVLIQILYICFSFAFTQPIFAVTDDRQLKKNENNTETELEVTESEPDIIIETEKKFKVDNNKSRNLNNNKRKMVIKSSKKIKFKIETIEPDLDSKLYILRSNLDPWANKMVKLKAEKYIRDANQRGNLLNEDFITTLVKARFKSKFFFQIGKFQKTVYILVIISTVIRFTKLNLIIRKVLFQPQNDFQLNQYGFRNRFLNICIVVEKIMNLEIIKFFWRYMLLLYKYGLLKRHSILLRTHIKFLRNNPIKLTILAIVLIVDFLSILDIIITPYLNTNKQTISSHDWMLIELVQSMLVQLISDRNILELNN